MTTGARAIQHVATEFRLETSYGGIRSRDRAYDAASLSKEACIHKRDVHVMTPKLVAEMVENEEIADFAALKKKPKGRLGQTFGSR